MAKKEDQSGKKKDFYKILSNKEVHTVFQPIVSLRDGSVLGYEALSRGPKGSHFEKPDVLFKAAKKYEELWELECLARTRAMEAAAAYNLDSRIFLNVNPNIIHDKRFHEGFTKEHLAKYALSDTVIVFEITEHEIIHNPDNFMQVVDHYKKQQFKIAIDDAGAGYSGLNLISDVQPHYVKIDMQLIRNIDSALNKQALVRALQQFAQATGIHLIAEGIETEEELIKLIEIGVHYGQGYFIQKPRRGICDIDDKVNGIIVRENKKKNSFFGIRIYDFYIKNISRPTQTVSSHINTEQVDVIFKKNELLQGLCVVNDDNLCGVIAKSRFYMALGSKYGYSLYAKKSIEKLMDTEFLCVDAETTVDIVAQKAMSRNPDTMYDFIVVTYNGKYFGTVTIKDLLEKSIEIEVMNAKNLNPLSELPGNVIIERQIEKAIESEERIVVLYLDIDNFKAYNDVYGFENGDQVLKLLAHLIKEHCKNYFAGHIGGDDFVAIVPESDAENFCKTIIKKFDKKIITHYKKEDLAQNFIIAKNRNGIEECFPIMSISIAGLVACEYQNSLELTENIAALKKACKQNSGSNFLLEKRPLED